jgi:hypothetical protein
MSWLAYHPPIEKGDLLPRSPISQAVEHRAQQVQCLVAKRRKIALAYKRTQDDAYRVELELLDRDLAQYRIDIPAIQRSAARTKKTVAVADR